MTLVVTIKSQSSDCKKFKSLQNFRWRLTSNSNDSKYKEFLTKNFVCTTSVSLPKRANSKFACKILRNTVKRKLLALDLIRVLSTDLRVLWLSCDSSKSVWRNTGEMLKQTRVIEVYWIVARRYNARKKREKKKLLLFLIQGPVDGTFLCG